MSDPTIFADSPENARLFELFVVEVAALLQRPRASLSGRALSLSQYLDTDERRGGDEQEVVDPLVRDLLGALGYREEHIHYNRLEAKVGRPDFQVLLASSGADPDLLVAPVLVVESKSTATRALDRAQPGRDESPIDQLRRYVSGLGVYGRMGLLCNGWVLEGWAFHDQEALVVRVDLANLSARGLVRPDDKAPVEEKWRYQRTLEALHALWSRCGIAAFQGAEEDLRRIARAVELPEEQLREILSAATSRSDPQDVERALARAHEVAWKKQAIDVRDQSERLVEMLRRLIDEMSSDVRHQFEDLFARVDGLHGEIQREEERADLDAMMRNIRVWRPRFACDDASFEARCIKPLQAWRETPRRGYVRDTADAIWAALRPDLVVREDVTGEQISLALGGAGGEDRRRAIKERKAEVAAKVNAALHEYCQVALDLSLAKEHLRQEHLGSVRVERAWQLWSERISSTVLVDKQPDELHQEFARQTAYVYIVRLLLVRICEDKGLFSRKFSNGGLVSWQAITRRYLDYAAGRSYEYLTRMAYECAQNVYLHFYGASELFDWYRMDEKRLLRALAALNTFDLEHIDEDIIGAVYGRYIKEGKHETGRYYTARSVVRDMLDHAGWTRERLVSGSLDAEGRIRHPRLLDPACGSGSFLVEAARRILDVYRDGTGRVPPEAAAAALEQIRGSLHGIDINPFACYLAEINLLIQVLDLLKLSRAAGETMVVDRFRIFCDDALMVDESLPQINEKLLPLDSQVVDFVKARTGPWAGGFDVIVSNPPYVRADESPDTRTYRARIAQQEWFATKHQKWDLFVPFVERSFHLLSDAPDARACLITISSICNAPYAESLRTLLATRTTLHRLVFAEHLRLFPDADWQDNLIFVFSRTRPPEGWRVHRFRLVVVEGGALSEQEDGSLPITDVDRLFNSRPGMELDMSGAVRLDRICYISKGMVLHSNERLKPGEPIEVPSSYDAARNLERELSGQTRGTRVIAHRPFKKEDLASDVRTAIHTRAYVEPEQIFRGGAGQHRFLEYGPHTRCPSRISRPTFPELFERPKLMVGTFAGVAVDEGGPEGFFTTSHSLTLAVRWCDLEGVDNRSLKDAREEIHPDPALSTGFSLWYLLALMLSDPIQSWLHANKRSMKDHVYPDDLKIIPIKCLSPEDQAPFVALTHERADIWTALARLRALGRLSGRPGTERPDVAISGTLSELRPQLPRLVQLAQLPITGLVAWESGAEAEALGKVVAREGALWIGRQKIGEVPRAVADRERIATVLGKTLQEGGQMLRDRANEIVPGDAAGWLRLAEAIDAAEGGIRALTARRAEIDAQLDAMAWALYRPRAAIRESQRDPKTEMEFMG